MEEFSEIKYLPFYQNILGRLDEMQRSERQGPKLLILRRDIARDGW